jgi:hypothetical protein
MIYPFGLALFVLLMETAALPAQLKRHTALGVGIAPQKDVLVGRWRGQEEDVIIDLEFTANHTLLIRHGTKKVFKIFRYTLYGNMLTLIAEDESISRQSYQLQGRTLTFSPKEKTRTESIDLLYDLPFRKLGQ